MGTRQTRWMTVLSSAALIAALLLSPAFVWAGVIWDAGGVNTNINTNTNWDSDTTPALTGGTSVLSFSVPSNAGTTVTVNTITDVLGLSFNRTAGSIYNFNAGGGTLTIGASGITVQSTSTDQINIGPNPIFNGSQSLTHNGSGLFLINGNSTGTGSPTLSNNGTGTGMVQFAGTLNNTISKLIQNSATSNLALRNLSNSFLDLEIKKGTVVVGNGGTALGSNAGVLMLGNSGGGSDAATLLNSNNGTESYAKPITLASGVTGLLTIGQNDDGSATAFTVTFTGGVTGSNSVTIENRGGNENIAFTTNTFNNAGKITHIGTGTGTATIGTGAVIGTNVTGVEQNSATSVLILNSANTFTTGLTIKAGTVTGNNANSFGANSSVITLGNSSGSANATLTGAGAVTFANPITVASTNTGVATINSTANATFSGAVTLNSHDLTLAASASTLSLTGGITGTGNLTLATTGGGTTTVSTNPVNISGTITNSGTGVGLSTISSSVGSGVTAITENSSTSGLTVSGALSMNSGGTTLTNSNAAGTSLLTVSGGISGTGNLVLKNNSAIANGITISTNAVNNAGTITNSGTGTGSVLISSTIGSNVTQIIQNSANSQLVLSGSGGTGPASVSITAGTLQINASNVLPDAATVSINGGALGIASGSSDTVASVSILGGSGNVVSGTGTLGVTGGITATGLTGPAAVGSNILFAGSQSVANNSNFLLTLTSVSTNFSGSGSPTITNAGTGTGGVNFQGTVPNTVSKIIQNSATSTLSLRSGSNGFADLEIKKGTVEIGNSGTVMGTGTLTLGNSLGGTDSASLFQNDNADASYSKNITLAPGVTGTLTIGILDDGSGTARTVTYGGTVTGNNSVTFENRGGNEIITVTGLVNIVGTVTHTGSGTGFMNLNNVGSNVTGIIQDSATSQLNLRFTNASTAGVIIKKGTVSFGNSPANLGPGPVTIGDSAGGSNAATLLVIDNSTLSFANALILAPNTTGTLTIAVADDTGVNTHTFIGGVTGNNHLTIESRTGDDRLTFSTNALNNAGTITHTGVGTGVVTINSVIGPNVTGLTQNSAAVLTLTAANTFAGDTKITSGTLTIGNNLALQNSALDTSGAGVVNITGFTTPTLGGLKGSTNLASVITTGYGSVTSLTLNPGTGATPSYAGVIADGAAGMTLAKSGAGTQTFTGANTYTGATSVSGGTLELGAGGSIANTASVTVGSSAFVGGSDRLLLTNTGTHQLGTGNLIVGNTEAGSVDHNAGTVTVGDTDVTLENVRLGVGAAGTYNMNGGTLNVGANASTGRGNLIVGDGNTGALNVGAGATINTGDLLVGNNAGTGSVTQTGGTINVLNPSTYTLSASDSGGTALVNQAGGTTNVTGGMVLGNGTGLATQNQYNLSGGVLDFGDTAGATAHHGAGTTPASTLSINIDGTFNLTGTGSLQDISTITANGGAGTFTQAGGRFFIGQDEPAHVVSAGNNPGLPDVFARTTTINGGFSLLAGGTMYFDAFGPETTPTDFSNVEPIDLLRVTGTANLNGRIDFDDEYGAELGDVHTLIVAQNITLGPNFAIDGAFFRLLSTGPTGPGFALQAIVPEPASVALWSVLGLAAIGYWRCGRIRRQAR